VGQTNLRREILRELVGTAKHAHDVQVASQVVPGNLFRQLSYAVLNADFFDQDRKSAIRHDSPPTPKI
jgi:hypothetical protein